MTSPEAITGLADVDEATIADIAEACNLPASSIADIYSCTPILLAMIDQARSKVFHFVMSFGPAADVDRFCEALRQVVSQNSILRTRIVSCSRLGTVQVVTSQDHVTERVPGSDAERLVRDGGAPRLGLGGSPLLTSVLVGRELVISVHHAIMGHWSMTVCLRQDVAGAYYGHPPPSRPAFKRFVEHCMAIDEPAARSFWAARFRGRVPAVFPRAMPDYAPCASQKSPLKVTLDRIGNGGIPAAHVAYYCEAAWALTSSMYAGSESVAYGYVLSGRSPSLNGLEDTLGLTIAEVPVQADLRGSMTV